MTLVGAVLAIGGSLALGAFRRDLPSQRLTKRKVTNPQNLIEAEEALERLEDDLDTFKFDLGRTLSHGAKAPNDGRQYFQCRDLAVSWDTLMVDRSGAAKSVANALINKETHRFDNTPVTIEPGVRLTWPRFSEKAQLIAERIEVWRGDAAKICPNIPIFFRRSDPKNPIFGMRNGQN